MVISCGQLGRSGPNFFQEAHLLEITKRCQPERILTVNSSILLQLSLFPGSNLFNRFGRDKSKTQISRVF
jgi:hypothetical protein